MVPRDLVLSNTLSPENLSYDPNSCSSFPRFSHQTHLV